MTMSVGFLVWFNTAWKFGRRMDGMACIVALRVDIVRYLTTKRDKGSDRKEIECNEIP
jgi:hypothetical protein